MGEHEHEWQESHYTATGDRVMFCPACGEAQTIPTSVDEAVEVHLAAKAHPRDGWDPAWTDDEAREALSDYFEEVKG